MNTWNVMPLAPSGGYIVVRGWTYRAAIKVGGALSGLANRGTIADYASKSLGFQSVSVWQNGLDTLPADWVNPPAADYFVQGICGVNQTLPASTSKGVWPVNATVAVVQALWYGVGQLGGQPPAPAGGIVPSAVALTSPVATWLTGGALLTGAYFAYEWWKKRKMKR